MIAGRAAVVYLTFAWPAVFAAPVLRRAFPKLPDGGVAIARPIAWLLIAWFAWFLPSLSLAPYGTPLVLVGAALLAAGGIWCAIQDRREWGEIFRRHGWAILLGEAIGIAVFVFFVWDVQWNGDVHPAAERFMDYAILERLGLTRTFPPLDAWMAGKTLQYYYYGYVVMDVLRRLAGMELRWFFNLAIAGVYSTFAMALYGGGTALVGKETRRPWLGGIAAFVGGSLVGNFDFVRQILVSRWNAGRWIFYPIDWFHASRVINGTINETPAFSVFWGDLHPYFISFPLVAAVATLAIGALRADELPFAGSRGHVRWLALFLLAIGLGSLFPTNSWDFPTFTVVAMVAIAGKLLPSDALALLRWDAWKKDGVLTRASMKERFLAEWQRWLRELVVIGGTLAVASVVLYLPFHIGFGKQVGRGIGLAQRRSDAIPMMVHFGPWFLVMVGWAIATAKDSGHRLQRALPIPATALALVIYEKLLEAHVASAIGALSRHGGALLVVSQGLDHLLLRGLAFVLVIAALWTMLGDLELSELSTMEGAARALTAGALGLVLICEFAFLRDFYGGDNERMNTVFKAYVQAWILFGLGGSGLLVATWRAVLARTPRWRWSYAGATAIVLVCGLSFLSLADYTRSGRWHGTRSSPRPTWDAEDLFRRTLPEDARAVDWIRTNLPPDATILESTAHAYEWPSRIATFSGRICLVGWKNHESGWRNSWELAMDRDAAIQAVYAAPDLETAQQILHKYGIEYVYVGDLERAPVPKEHRTWNLEKFEGWPAVYRNERVAIYRVPAASAAVSKS